MFQGEGKVIKANVLDVLPEIEADVAYFDPPYPGVMSYEREYRIIDQILEGVQRETSPFTATDGRSDDRWTVRAGAGTSRSGCYRWVTRW